MTTKKNETGTVCKDFDKVQIPYTGNLEKNIHNEILSQGFYMIRTREMQLSDDSAKKFYMEHRDKFFFNRLVTFMCSGPLMVHILAREDAIQKWRLIMGPTKVFKTQFTHPNSLRGIYGLTDTRNATHGSDSEDSARKEIKFFFPDFDVDEWYKKYENTFSQGQVKYDEEKKVHIPVKEGDIR